MTILLVVVMQLRKKKASKAVFLQDLYNLSSPTYSESSKEYPSSHEIAESKDGKDGILNYNFHQVFFFQNPLFTTTPLTWSETLKYFHLINAQNSFFKYFY